MRANSFTRFGLTVAAVTCLLDQASKLCLLKVVDLAANGPLRMGPFFDFVLTRNTGISYGLFRPRAPWVKPFCWRSRRWRWSCSGSG